MRASVRECERESAQAHARLCVRSARACAEHGMHAPCDVMHIRRGHYMCDMREVCDVRVDVCVMAYVQHVLAWRGMACHDGVTWHDGVAIDIAVPCHAVHYACVGSSRPL